MNNPTEMTYPERKKLATELGLDNTGTSDVLLERIQKHMIEELQTKENMQTAVNDYKEVVSKEVPDHVKEDIRQDRQTLSSKDDTRIQEIVARCNMIFGGRANASFNKEANVIEFRGGVRQAEDALIGQPKSAIYAHATRFVSKALGAPDKIGTPENPMPRDIKLTDLPQEELAKLVQLVKSEL